MLKTRCVVSRAPHPLLEVAHWLLVEPTAFASRNEVGFLVWAFVYAGQVSRLWGVHHELVAHFPASQPDLPAVAASLRFGKGGYVYPVLAPLLAFGNEKVEVLDVFAIQFAA